MTTSFKIRVYDPNDSWNQIALLTDEGGFGRFSFTEGINQKSNYSLHIPGFELSTIRGELTPDLLFEFQRKVVDESGKVLKDWYTAFWGLHRTPTYQLNNQGSWYVKSFGYGATELLLRREVAYYSGSNNTDKNGAGETVIKAYADENIGPNALTSNGRLLIDGAMPSFSIATDNGGGDNWDGAAAFDNLLDACQKVARSTNVDFKVNVTGPGTWEFDAKARPWGVDRSTDGLDRSTGLNGAGNTPVVFSTENNTLAEVSYSKSRTEEENTIFILGKGRGSDRDIALVENTTWQSDSPINQREGSKNATGEGQYNAYVSSSEGESLLKKRGPQETLSFRMVQSPGRRWGIDYDTGDLVQIRIPELGFDFPVQVHEVNVTYDDRLERIEHEVTKWL